ncbi:hypothetical protein EPN52_00935 [bacterium]|nr:MAG: hypothetical protein EPN52_00935 [bacterium]
MLITAAASMASCTHARARALALHCRVLRFFFSWPLSVRRFIAAYDRLPVTEPLGSSADDLIVLHTDGTISLETTYSLGGNDHAYSYAETEGVDVLVTASGDDPRPCPWRVAAYIALGLYVDPLISVFRALECSLHRTHRH